MDAYDLADSLAKKLYQAIGESDTDIGNIGANTGLRISKNGKSIFFKLNLQPGESPSTPILYKPWLGKDWRLINIIL